MSAFKQEGVLSGLKAFSFRYNNCRKGYKIKLEGDQFVFLTVKNQRIEKKDVKPSIIDAFFVNKDILLMPESITVRSVKQLITKGINPANLDTWDNNQRTRQMELAGLITKIEEEIENITEGIRKVNFNKS